MTNKTPKYKIKDKVYTIINGYNIRVAIITNVYFNKHLGDYMYDIDILSGTIKNKDGITTLNANKYVDVNESWLYCDVNELIKNIKIVE